MTEKTKQEHFRLSEEMGERLEDLKGLWGLNTSEAIRYCILSAYGQAFGSGGKPKKAELRSEVFPARGGTSVK